MPLIPVANLYYLLCYAWNVVPPSGLLTLEPEALAGEPQPAVHLLAHLLAGALTRRARRGHEAVYTSRQAYQSHVRGRILIGQLARDPRAALAGRLPCRFQEPTPDTPLNRLLALALRQLLATDELTKRHREALRAALVPLAALPAPAKPLLAAVRAAEASLRPGDLTGQLLLRIAELLLLNLLPAPGTLEPERTRYRFHDFVADEVQMGRIFEAFVRNFLRREQQRAAVSSEVLRWHGATATTAAALPLLPVMRTDTTLTTATRKLVIDTKFYARPLNGSRFASDRLLAPHLYQLLAYLRNQPKDDGQRVEGMLLYPSSFAAPQLALDYQLEGFRVRVCTLDLSRKWSQISTDLLALVAE